MQVSHPIADLRPNTVNVDGNRLCSDYAEPGVELGRSNATRRSHFAKDVSTLVGLATVTSLPSEFVPVNPSTTLMLAAPSEALA